MKLVNGAGRPGEGACYMSAISYYMGYEWSDHPECVCPVIRILGIVLNDSLPNDKERERVIGPILFDPVGTNDGIDMTVCRAQWIAQQVSRRVPVFDNLTGEPSDAYFADAAAHQASRYVERLLNTTFLVEHFRRLAYNQINHAVQYAVNAVRRDPETLKSWILELCSWSTRPELDQERVKKTIREACLGEVSQ